MSETRAGFIAVVGRPNVGKSTLINALVGARVSITTPKPQTTRHRILGIRTEDSVQMIFVDTPGIHTGGKSAMKRMLNQTAGDSMRDADCVLWLVQSNRWTDEDAAVLERLRTVRCPVGLIVTKVDLVKDKAELMPFIAKTGSRRAFDFVVPLSATKGNNLDALLAEVTRVLPESPLLFESEQVTDRGEHFRMAELIRERLFMSLDQELPYAITVEIESDEPMEDGRRHVSAVIWVARDSHKGIVIGKQGARLKQVGSEARRAIQADLGQGLHLQLWCRVKRGWADDERALASLGFDLPDQG